MIKKISISCPHCHNDSKIFLSIDPSVVILNCPNCSTPLVIEENHVCEAKNSKNYSLQKPEVRNIIDIFSNNTHRKLKTTNPKLTMTKSIVKKRFKIISKEEILDLKIELSKSLDVLDFIKNI